MNGEIGEKFDTVFGCYWLDLYHALSWPGLSYVAEDSKGRIVGYILAKMLVHLILFLGMILVNIRLWNLGKRTSRMMRHLMDTLLRSRCCEGTGG